MFISKPTNVRGSSRKLILKLLRRVSVFSHHPHGAYNLCQLKVWVIGWIKYNIAICRYGKIWSLVKCGRICNSGEQWLVRSGIRICNIIRNLINYIISIDLMDLPWLCICVVRWSGVNWNRKWVYSYVMSRANSYRGLRLLTLFSSINTFCFVRCA